jgi:hypothetical protein
MLIGDILFPSLINEAKPTGMGYGHIPYFGLLINPPLACLIFENIEKGRECFQHFKKWSEDSGDGDAVALNFIEKINGGYVICIYQELNRLIDRSIPKYLKPEVSPISNILVTFPLVVEKTSNEYLLFKEEAEKNPFIFCGGSTTGQIFKNLAIRKREIRFYKENKIPKNSPESAYSGIIGTHRKPKLNQKLPIETNIEIINRRKKRLQTFFPITLEGLAYNSRFKKSKGILISEGFANWQISQAACNVVASYRMCNKPHFESLKKETGPFDILKFLLNTIEEPTSSFPPIHYFSIDILRYQIVADTIELLNYIRKKPKNHSKTTLLNNLQKYGYLK